MACSNLIKFYVRRITVDKKMTIDDVPERWREQVRAEIEKAEQAVQWHLRMPSIDLCDNYFYHIIKEKGENKLWKLFYMYQAIMRLFQKF